MVVYKKKLLRSMGARVSVHSFPMKMAQSRFGQVFAECRFSVRLKRKAYPNLLRITLYRETLNSYRQGAISH